MIKQDFRACVEWPRKFDQVQHKTDYSSPELAELGCEVAGQLVEELEGVEVVAALDVLDAALDAERKVLGHVAGLNGLDAHGLQGISELTKL